MNAQDDVHDEGGRRLDQIRLTGLSATGYHGVFAHERREGQTFVADVVVHLDTRRAAAGDDLAHTVDYGELAQLVVAVLGGEPVDLVETVAERIAATVLARPHVQAVDVAVHKPQAPITVPFGDVVVAIRRDRTKLPAAEPYRPPTGQVRRGDGRHPVTADQPGARSAPPLAEPPAPTPEPAQPVPVATAQAAPPVPARVSVADALSGGVPTTDAGRRAHDAGPDGAGAVLVGPAPTGAVPTGVMPAVPAGPAAEAWSAPHEEPSYSYDGPPTELMAPVVDVERTAPTSPAPEAARTELMAPVTDVVEGELVLDAFDEPPAHPVRAVLALGANLGPAQDTLRQAVADLAATPGLEVVAVSPLARTAAVGPEQPDYLNAVVLTRTTLAPRELLRAVQAVELRHGRERREHWGPRTLDIDVVVHGETLGVTDDLELPHPRAHQRAFVLQPWAQVDPEAVLPGLGGGPVALLAATAPDRDGVRWMALDWLTAPVPAANAEPDGAGEAHHP
ncbi:2-amino-4-hydroxy-6-hydroxymethyldihydropteridine diphosphokinase [Cellulomonas wangsupingiae]|uniref:Bifunctional folate synthesis protein n=1 Tax=Cellulomonas wangsupingiae TaxID=2968085 RepID=A0ABY5K7G6_9CELL|nr:2-amino-4-hydroxy-6-hydroxymethyldihydropteridine diphosphokinase [Cellulomonas wangsupingiae]MCC2336510.1 2-amino-4-hydroxy-6-hydroxymethyldihydropteridine diphosphokinase [Cellulomonas wangsupingiae]UUI65754.1 2-amino-4-hydroxy-6-hydroxymethyldihydropteridine diphosphokinase [Cellulomonas wangsupingiae]